MIKQKRIHTLACTPDFLSTESTNQNKTEKKKKSKLNVISNIQTKTFDKTE